MSVILIVDSRRQRSTDALQSLLTQKIIDRMEILLIDFSTLPPLPGSTHPAVRMFREKVKSSFGQIKAKYVALARAPIVAFFEDHCIAGEGWAEAIVRAHQSDFAGVGGKTSNGNPDLGISNASYLFSHGFYLPPPASETTTLLPENNSYKRDVLLSYADDLPGLLDVDVLLHWRLQQDGKKLIIDSNIRFAYLSEISAKGLCKGYYWYNRCFGRSRVRILQWPLRKRLAYTVLSPMIPLVRVFRAMVSVVRYRQKFLFPLFRNLPLLILANCSAVIGQTIGLWRKDERDPAYSKFLNYELNEPRTLMDK